MTYLEKLKELMTKARESKNMWLMLILQEKVDEERGGRRYRTC